MSTYEERMQNQLPGDWLLSKESGWFPLGEGGKLIDITAWVVIEPHNMAYGHAQDRINRAEAVGKSAPAAIKAFFAKHPGTPPRAQ